MSSNRLSALIDQIGHSLPFFPLVTLEEEIVSPIYSHWTLAWIKIPISRETHMAGSEKVHGHLKATNTELEALIAKMGVPKTKAMLLQ